MRLHVTVPAALLSWLLLSVPAIAYNPLPSELLSRMESGWRKIKPVEVTLERSAPDTGSVQVILQVPAAEGTPPSSDPSAWPGLVPYALLISGGEYMAGVFPSLASPGAVTSLTRLDSFVCYLLEGAGQRLWLRKADLVPLRVEIRLENDTWAASSYRSLVVLDERLSYPMETLYERKGETTVVERLLNPPPPSP